ncbi:alpha/beta fold hydrolase [Phaeodactylibacter luteus]|uniref:Alpha/beta hydrolase n=1 Tax=Phaeodactylibacter luteus TaxID=1564516 RepID=A0A5C6RXJ6_9BACT|nr:alpha/beta hydrolase [Phaeodactylibacter luteus]TXB66549.1 alpha/beta hydrolase [Phaeodactylibacter luteus]
MPQPSNFETLLQLMRQEAAVDHAYVEAAGIKTSYLTAGAGPALLLLHGAGGGAVNWYKILPSLARNFRVIAPDKPGYGESDKPWGDYSQDFYTRWLAALIEKLDIPSFFLAGSSQGGAVSLAYSLKHPGQVRKLVLSDAAGLSDDWDRSIIPKMVLYRLFPSDFWGRLLGNNVMKDPSVAHPAWHRYSMEVIRKPGGRYPFFLGRGKAVRTFTDEELRSVSMPTLIIWGEDETFFPLSHAHKAARLIPRQQLAILPQAGHLPWMEQPTLFTSQLTDFLLSG